MTQSRVRRMPAEAGGTRGASPWAPRLGRCLTALGLGVAVGACGTGVDSPDAPHNEGAKIVISNDRAESVTLEYCERQRCSRAQEVVLDPGREHAFPLRDVAVGESADSIRIVEGAHVYCVVVPSSANDGSVYRFNVSTAEREKCE